MRLPIAPHALLFSLTLTGCAEADGLDPTGGTWDSYQETIVVAGATPPSGQAPNMSATNRRPAKPLGVPSAAGMGLPGGVVSPYVPFALSSLDIAANPDAWPAWRRGIKAWHWARIPGSDLSSVSPAVPVPGNLRNRIDAWNGLAADRRRSRLYSAGNGGHADYAGNEVYEIDLSVDAPRWVMLREPTVPENIVASSASKGIHNDYYLDGRPSSTHTYYALNYLASRNAIFKFGSGSIWGSGNERNWKTDAFSMAANDWMPAGTWPDVVPGTRKDSTGASICMNPSTEEIYVAALGLRRFDPRTGTFTRLEGRWPQNATAAYTRACAVDTRRNRIAYFGDAYRVPTGGLVYDIASDSFIRIDFTGDGVAELTAKGSNFAWYDPRLDRFLLKSQVASNVYAIDPDTFVSTLVKTTGGEDMPNARNGVHTRWQRLPALGGYAYYARHGDGIWFLATE